jgi:hypothetical protein
LRLRRATAHTFQQPAALSFGALPAFSDLLKSVLLPGHAGKLQWPM